MKKVEIDFHGFSLLDALNIVDAVVNKARIFNTHYDCTFITGRGIIKKELLEVLKVTYKLNPFVPFYNDGMILVEIY
jgi:hypothetical protein